MVQKNILRFLPLFLILLIAALIYACRLDKFCTFETIKSQHENIKNYVSAHPLLTPLYFMGIFAFLSALPIPVTIFLSIVAGYLFPQPWGTAYVVVASVGGALLTFLAARTAFGNKMKRIASPFLFRIKKGFKKNAVSYLLCLRIIPFCPFWPVNLAPAIFHIPLWTFVWTTAIGLIPASFVFAEAGRGLEMVVMTEEVFSAQALFNKEIKIALIALCFC